MDSAIRNYIPHKTSSDFYDWESKYFDHLLNMFTIFERMLSKNRNIDWNNPITFRKFCRMIYNSSSGHISEHLQEKNELLYKQYISQVKYE